MLGLQFPVRVLPVQGRRPDFESPEAIQSQVGEHASIIQCFWDAMKVETGPSLDALGSKSLALTRVCVCNCAHVHTHTNK